MAPLILAWLIGEGIVTWRWAKAGAPPTPGALAASSGMFVLLAVLAEYQPARGAATLLAYGIDLAALLKVLPGGTPAQQTGWPPLKINDPTVFLPAGSSGQGKLLPEGAGTSPAGGGGGGSQQPGGPGSSGGCPPGYYMIGGNCVQGAAD